MNIKYWATMDIFVLDMTHWYFLKKQ